MNRPLSVTPSDTLPAWQIAEWDRRMEEMEERYRYYSNEPKRPKETPRVIDNPIVEADGPAVQPIAVKRPIPEKLTLEQIARFTSDWDDPGNAYEPTEEDLDWLAVQEKFKKRESGLCALIRNRSADKIEADAWKASIEARRQLNADSEWIAQMLQAGGEKGFKPGHAPRAAILDLITGLALDLPHTVGKNFIPCEAAKKRAKMLISAEKWCERNPLDRFWVMHGPGRVPVNELRATVRAIGRKLSKLNAEPFMKASGVRLNLRITEIGGLTFERVKSTGEVIEEVETATKDGARLLVRLARRKGTRWIDRNEREVVEHRDAKGRWTFYPHINVLAHFTKGKIDNTPGPVDPATGQPGPSDWQRFLSRIHEFWEWGWKECGGLDDIREAIKYCAKPADLRRMSAPEVCDVARALYRCHLAQPLGLLKEEISSRRIHCLKLARWRNKRTGHLEIREMEDPNARKRDRRVTEEQKKRQRDRARRRAELREAAIAALLADGKPAAAVTEKETQLLLGMLAAAVPAPVHGPTDREIIEACMSGRACALGVDTPKKRIAPPAVIRNRVVARMVGTSPFVPRVGPQVLVWGFDGTAESLASIRALPFVAPMLEAAGLDAGQRPDPIKVHTSPVTVRGLGFDTAEAWERPPNPATN